MGHPERQQLMFTPEQVAAGLDPQVWTLRLVASLERSAVDPEGNAITINDAVMHAVRT